MIVTLALRACQIVFSLIILGLSTGLIKGQVEGSAPSATSYADFCGGLGVVVGIIGVVAVFVEALQVLAMIILDAGTAVFTLAGGIAYAIALKGGKCSDEVYIHFNDIIRGASTWLTDPDSGVSYPAWDGNGNLHGRCAMAQAVMVFLFVAFLAFAATAATGFMKKGGRNASFV